MADLMKPKALSKQSANCGVTTYSSSVRPALSGVTPSDRLRTKSPLWTRSGRSSNWLISVSMRRSLSRCIQDLPDQPVGHEDAIGAEPVDHGANLGDHPDPLGDDHQAHRPL